jgi:hypothetical protein
VPNYIAAGVLSPGLTLAGLASKMALATVGGQNHFAYPT